MTERREDDRRLLGIGRDAGKRAALLDSLRGMIASDARQMLGGIADALRDEPAFRLPDEARDAILLDHLPDAMLAGLVRARRQGPAPRPL